MAEVFLRQIAGFLRTTTCTMDMVEVFLRRVPVSSASRTWLRFSSGSVPVSSAPPTINMNTKNQDTYPSSVEVFLRQSAGFLNTTKTVEGFLRQIAGSLSTTNRLKIM